MVTSQVARWFAPVMRAVVAVYGLLVAVVVDGVSELDASPGDAVTVTTCVDGAGVSAPSMLEHEARLIVSRAAAAR